MDNLVDPLRGKTIKMTDEKVISLCKIYEKIYQVMNQKVKKGQLITTQGIAEEVYEQITILKGKLTKTQYKKLQGTLSSGKSFINFNNNFVPNNINILLENIKKI